MRRFIIVLLLLLHPKISYLLSDKLCRYAVMSGAMRSAHAPKACITAEGNTAHEVRITFRKGRITQKSTFVDRQKCFFVGPPEGIRTPVLQNRNLLRYPAAPQAEIYCIFYRQIVGTGLWTVRQRISN